MNQQSEFQKQNPLSPKKFWKKFISGSLGSCLLALILGCGIGFSLLMVASTGDPSDNGGVIIAMILGAVLLVLVLIAVVQAIYIRAYINMYYYDCNDQFITIKKGVFTPKEIHVQYQKIQDVYVDQDLFDRIMGLYDVHIASATVTSGLEAHIDGVEQATAENIKNFLLEKIRTGGRAVHDSAPTQSSAKAESNTPTKVSFKGEISSKTYPISNMWLISASIGAFFSSLLITVVLTFWFGGMLSEFGLPFEFLLVLVCGLFFIALIGSIGWYVVWKSNYYFEFTPDYILLKTGVISRQENHMPYTSIQNVTITQGIVERLFGLATVKIENASQQVVKQGKYGTKTIQGGVTVVGQPLSRAQDLNNVLSDIVSKQNPSNNGL